MSDLLTEIEAAERQVRKDGRRNHKTDNILTFSAILVSAVATWLAFSRAHPVVTAIAAGIPGVCATLQASMNFRGRSSWYFLMAARLRGLARALRDQSADASKISELFSELEVDMESQWTSMVTAKAQPPTLQSLKEFSAEHRAALKANATTPVGETKPK
jgi:hypothetical protein